MGEQIALQTGSALYVERMGQGAPILFMHGGLGLDHSYLKDCFHHLGQSHELIFYDHFGNGRSSIPSDYAEMSLERLVEDAAALLDALGLSRVVLVGHSYGGFVAQKFAARYADRLAGLALLSTSPALDYARNPKGTPAQMAAFARLFSGPAMSDAEWAETWARVSEIYVKDFDPRFKREVGAEAVYRAAAWTAGARLLKGFSMLEALPRIEVPSFVAGGRHDQVVLASHGPERIAALLPNAELTIFENSAHYPFYEEHDAFFEKFEAWLGARDCG